MSSESSLLLETLFAETGNRWMLDLGVPSTEVIPIMLKRLKDAENAFENRFGYKISFAPDALRKEADRNPHRIAAFLQAVATSANAEMLVMVWRILQGLNIREVKLCYREQEAFSLGVALGRPDGAEVEEYHTENIFDAALVRHFGIMTLSGKPVFDGFFPHHWPSTQKE